MNNPNPFEFNFSADESGAVQRPVFNFLIKTLGPSFLACLLIVLVGNVVLRMIPLSQHMTWPFLFAIVVFIPFFQTGRSLRLPGSTVRSTNRAVLSGIGAIAAIVGVAVARRMLFLVPPLWLWFSNSAIALTTSILLIVLRRIVFGKMKLFPLMIAILPSAVFSMIILTNAIVLMHQKVPLQFTPNGHAVEAVAFCLYAHIVCAAWWLFDKSD
ncbi:MAG: hypothetical protein WKF77_28240 [Planctomycetaceae bacterium]